MINLSKIYKVIKTAEGYFAVGAFLSDYESKKTIKFLMNYVSPCIVNLSFSCELYLKAIILIEDRECNSKLRNGYHETHHLDTLYNDLSLESMSLITSRYNKLINELSGFWTLEQCIHEYDNAFIGWRYRFEQPNAMFDINSLKCLALVLQKVCEDLYNSLIT
jgi:hypothetical protein